ncbi:MAG TPA: aquaporin, partial [Clostridiales bacterium]|nr:aquaporin [Clostridiales bacterium]
MTCKIPTLFRKFAAEFLGTMILVVFGCGAALLFSPTFPLTTLTVALAFGLVIIAMAAAIGDISGCHINPAVSLAMLLDGRMGIGEFFTYLAAQFLGGIAGGGVLALISNGNVQSGLGSNGYLKLASSHISILGAFVIEIILTFVFVFVILRVTKKAENGKIAGFVIG